MAELEQRLDRLEAESEIRQLVARYCFTIDDRDLDCQRRSKIRPYGGAKVGQFQGCS